MVKKLCLTNILGWQRWWLLVAFKCAVVQLLGEKLILKNCENSNFFFKVIAQSQPLLIAFFTLTMFFWRLGLLALTTLRKRKIILILFMELLVLNFIQISLMQVISMITTWHLSLLIVQSLSTKIFDQFACQKLTEKKLFMANVFLWLDGEG